MEVLRNDARLAVGDVWCGRSGGPTVYIIGIDFPGGIVHYEEHGIKSSHHWGTCEIAMFGRNFNFVRSGQSFRD